MKMFHALVGYLAATALPHFHPFAFAASGIHYDGPSYVDTTENYNTDGALTKHNILETSQTVTSHTGSLNGYVNSTQNHSDIETRQLPLPILIPLVGIVISTVVLVITTVSWIADDNPVRGNDVEYLIIEHSD